MTAPATSVPPCPLTARQLQIVELVAQGQSNPMIAETLGLSVLTVKAHLTRILHAVDARNRAHLAFICLQAGWIT